MSDEIWKDIAGYEGLYQVSNLGRVKSLSRIVKSGKNKKRTIREKILIQSKHSEGYLIITITKNNKHKKSFVHRLVAEAFIPNPNNYAYINHINNNPECNLVENLEWCTQKQNVAHTIKQGRNSRGEKSVKSKLTEEDVKWIRKNYIPYDKNFGEKAISEKFNVFNSTIRRIIKRINWKHIP